MYIAVATRRVPLEAREAGFLVFYNIVQFLMTLCLVTVTYTKNIFCNV